MIYPNKTVILNFFSWRNQTKKKKKNTQNQPTKQKTHHHLPASLHTINTYLETMQGTLPVLESWSSVAIISIVTILELMVSGLDPAAQLQEPRQILISAGESGFLPSTETNKIVWTANKLKQLHLSSRLQMSNEYLALQMPKFFGL